MGLIRLITVFAERRNPHDLSPSLTTILRHPNKNLIWISTGSNQAQATIKVEHVHLYSSKQQ